MNKEKAIQVIRDMADIILIWSVGLTTLKLYIETGNFLMLLVSTALCGTLYSYTIYNVVYKGESDE